MEDDAEEIKLGENSIEQPKKFVTLLRNKWITSEAGSIDDFIKVYEDLAKMMRGWKDKDIILDLDIFGAVGDDYAQFCTNDETVAQQEGFEEEVFEDYNDEEFEESDSQVLQFEVNEYISLKLIDGRILSYVDGERFD